MNRLSMNCGFNIMIEDNTLEYGVGYEANISRKYLGHQGSLKLRVNL